MINNVLYLVCNKIQLIYILFWVNSGNYQETQCSVSDTCVELPSFNFIEHNQNI